MIPFGCQSTKELCHTHLGNLQGSQGVNNSGSTATMDSLSSDSMCVSGLLGLDPALGPPAPAPVQPHQQPRARKPPKRQASDISGELMPLHLYDLPAVQQQGGNWVGHSQMWPADMQQQQLACPWGDPVSHAAPGAAGMMRQPDPMLQQQLHYGPAQHAGGSAAGPPPAAPQHWLPKRRASAPHLLANIAAPVASSSQPTMFKCVPHTGGPDCQCTQCLCARTDELCRRLIAQRSAQAAAAGAGGAAAQPQQQQQQQQQGGQSPVHAGKRHSFELPPAGKSRKSPNKPSPGSSPPSSNLIHYAQRHGQPHQQQQVSAFAGAAMVASGPAAGGSNSSSTAGDGCGSGLAQQQQRLSSAGSAQLRGQFQALTVSPSSVFDGAGGTSAAAAAAAAAGGGVGLLPLQQRAVSAPALTALGPHEAGSGQSGVLGYEEDAAIDRELEQMLAQIGWAMDAGVATASSGGRQGSQLQQQRQQLQHQQRQQQQGYPGPGSSSSARHHAHGHGHHKTPPQLQTQHQQQQQVSLRNGASLGASTAAAGSACVAAAGVACTPAQQQEFDILQDLSAELRLPSFDQWDPLLPADGAAGVAGCSSLLLEGDLLHAAKLDDNNNDNSGEGTSLVDLLLN